MIVYRIVQSKTRTANLSGTRFFRAGGRWNSKGTYMVYTSETSSLTYLETLGHFDDTIYPPHLFIMEIEVDDLQTIYTIPENEYPKQWKRPGLLKNQHIGDAYMQQQHLAIKIKSAINTLEHNYLLNPRFHEYVSIKKDTEILVDGRLMQ